MYFDFPGLKIFCSSREMKYFKKIKLKNTFGNHFKISFIPVIREASPQNNIALSHSADRKQIIMK